VTEDQAPRQYAPLREVRLRAGLSQTQLGALIGVNPSHVSHVERGVRRPWPRFRREAARVLKVDEAVLFPEGR